MWDSKIKEYWNDIYIGAVISQSVSTFGVIKGGGVCRRRRNNCCS
jgi:hypothetical protein